PVLGRAEAAARARPAPDRAAAAVAARRAAHLARRRRAGRVRVARARASATRRADRRGDACAARHRRRARAETRWRRMMETLRAVFLRDLKIAFRAGGGAGVGVVFFLSLVTVVPFAVGPDLPLLARIGPAMLWIGALLATLLGLDRIFSADREDGSLDVMMLSATPLELIAAAKGVAHWVATGLPLTIAAPLFGLLLGVEPGALGTVTLTLLIGT